MGIDPYIRIPTGFHGFTTDEVSDLIKLLEPIDSDHEMYELPPKYAYQISETADSPPYPERLPAYRCRVGLIVCYIAQGASVAAALEWIEFIVLDTNQSQRDADIVVHQLQQAVPRGDSQWHQVGALPIR